MPYLDIRWTPEDLNISETDFKNYHTTKSNDIMLFIYNYLIELQKEREPAARDLPSYIYTQERFNKFGDQTHLHYHMNFHIPHHPGNLPIKKDNLQKQLNRKFLIRGNKMYCLRVHDDIPENIDRWWMYTVKQNKPVAYHGFTAEQIEQLHLLASTEYEQRKRENCETRLRMMDKNNFRNKIIVYLKKKFNLPGQTIQATDKELWILIAEFYRSNHHTPPFQKMDDLVIDMKVELGWLTLEQYYDLKHFA